MRPASHAVIGLTRSAAQEYGRAGIQVHAVAPGAADPPMILVLKRREPDITERLGRGDAAGTRRTPVRGRRKRRLPRLHTVSMPRSQKPQPHQHLLEAVLNA
jgi:NAD(P)-dependent dehydrogenase (short-subunit alcohol dehydrogenase family)